MPSIAKNAGLQNPGRDVVALRTTMKPAARSSESLRTQYRQPHSLGLKKTLSFSQNVVLHALQWCVLAILSVVGGWASDLHAAEIELPIGNTNAAIHVQGDSARQWEQGSYEVWQIRGNCELKQGDIVARSPQAILWVDRADPYSGKPSKVIAYFEGDTGGQVQVDYGHAGNPHNITQRKAQTIKDRTWVGRFHSTAGITMSVPLDGRGQPEVLPAIYRRGEQAWHGGVTSASASQTVSEKGREAEPSAVRGATYVAEELAAPTVQPTPQPMRERIRFFPRNNGRWQTNSFTDPDTGRQITIVTGGVQAVIEGLDQFGSVSLECDNIVAWTPRPEILQQGGYDVTDTSNPTEVYLEGNIVFRQGDRVIYAERMYYNASRQSGVVLDAEMLTPVKNYQGLLRLRAQVLQQVDRQHVQAYGTALTSSRIGVPRYWMQTQNAMLEDLQRPLIDPFTGQAVVDPETGEPEVEHQLMATAQGNSLYIGGVPVFYWPRIATDLTQPTYYIEQVRYKGDRVFGQQLYIDYDLFQMLGIQRKPVGHKWQLSTDLLSMRGPALGTNYRYQSEGMFGLSGPATGSLDVWALPHDSGLDNLGRDRLSVPLESTFRGRVFAQHRQFLPYDMQLTGEVGLISDRNFLEQYYENEWDTFKDQTTGIELKRLAGNTAWSVNADARLNEFFTQTQWLPKGDHYWIGKSLFADRLTWSTHSSVGFADMKIASKPTNPVDLTTFSYLPWEQNAQGARAVTAHELDLPIDAGPVKFVPYVMGQAAFWQNDLVGNDLSRLYGQAGVRASMPFWRADPEVQSELFNLNGLAHKVVLESEFFVAGANKSLDQLPLYDPLDDDSTEHFRRRMAVNTFGQPLGTFVPQKFDERYFALRSNLAGNVTSSSAEIADDLMVFRSGIKQRWQTKRGLAGQERIIDWIALDLNASFFPNATRDNFGSNIGLVDYNFRWHVGDRLTILSDGFYDDFDQGLRQITLGGMLSRPEYGSMYMGFRSTEGPVSSNVLVTSLSYRMSEKWIATAGSSIDFATTGNIGQTVALTRVGESFLVKLGFNVDASRNNFGFLFNIEPRFLPSSRLGRVGGVQIPPAGAMGLE